MNIQTEHLANIADTAPVAADVQVGYSDEDIILIDNVRILAEISPTRLQMNMVVFFVNGKAQGDINGQTTNLEKNQLLICPPNTMMSNYMLSPDFEMKAMFVSNRMLQSFLREKINVWTDLLYIHKLRVIPLQDHEIEFLNRFYELLKMVIDANPDVLYKTDIMHSLLRGAFLALCSALKSGLPTQSAVTHQPVHNTYRLFQRFIDLLGSTPVKHRSVESYANELCVTPKYLSLTCKKHSGKTANTWITEHVVEDIRYLLTSTDLSIKEVSVRLGFPNPSFFGKYVKEHFGVTPSQLREQQ